MEVVSSERLQSGARIRVRGFNKAVIFRRLDGTSAEIEAGPLRMKVAVDEIIGMEGAAPSAGTAKAASGSVSVRSQRGEGAPTEEINLIGSTVEEATERVDKFLDEAALAHIPRVRIIHGHGTGALRRGLGEFLKTHPLVAKQSFEAEDRGGKAVTVVELRS
jgi:DNA mismatch repair protein MutS2